ncbi:somatostatin receptor type 5-like [Branchiostoma floridae x Branchiostoma belcheri]
MEDHFIEDYFEFDYSNYPFEFYNYTFDGNFTYTIKDHSWDVIIYNVVAPVMQCAIGMTGLIGNGLIMYVIFKYASMKTVANVYVLNLAVADFLYCLTFPIWTIDYILRMWIFGRAMCKIVRSIFNINTFASIYILTMMSIERNSAVLHPVRNRTDRSLKKAKIICGSIWVFALLCCLPYIVFADTVDFGGVPVCLFNWHGSAQTQEWWRSVNAIYLMAMAFLVPLCIMVPNYVLIYRKLLNTDVIPPEFRRAVRSRHRVTRMVIVVVLTFIVCWLPLHIGNVIRFVVGHNVNATVWYFLNVIADINTCVNPFLYALHGENFRMTLRRTLCGSRCCPKRFRPTRQDEMFSMHFTSRRSTAGTPIELSTVRINHNLDWTGRTPPTFRTNITNHRRHQLNSIDMF